MKILPILGAITVLFVLSAVTMAQTPAPAFNCTVELDKLRAYASILKGDRDQKEAALAEYGSQLRALTAELNALKAAKDKETK